MVYGIRCAYYIAETQGLIFAVRLHVDEQKHIHFAFTAINDSGEPRQLYMASEIEAILRNADNEGFWDKMTKFGAHSDNRFLLRSGEDCLVIRSSLDGGEVGDAYHTCARGDLLGARGRSIIAAEAWKYGRFFGQRDSVTSTDIPTAADMIHITLKSGESARRELELSYYHSVAEAERALGGCIDVRRVDTALCESEARERESLTSMKIAFGDYSGGVNAQVLNQFIANVQKQVSFCALGKNYAGAFIGIRDVMQQLESSLMWQAQRSRAKILTAMQYILEDGRPPRQFSVPDRAGEMPAMDLRKFIDQGNWIISTVYSYLAFTDDFSLLDERCGYYIASEDNTRIIAKSNIVDTVLDHMIRIMDFMASHLDREGGTNCLHALRGDWNDSIDGLGFTDSPDREFGNGVAVMASLHFYQNCREMCEILERVGAHADKAAQYAKYREQIGEGLAAHAIETKENGERRIVHGWGDNMAYKLGSFRDPDGEDRVSSTSHSFWVLSGMIEKDPSLKKTILDAFSRLDSPYGMLTFDKVFLPSMRPFAGAIAGITPGTYENHAAYVHASMFAIMALFAIGESERAWCELEKSIVISHENCSMTPFVMPNSYCYNLDFGIDGESLGDWYTGSGTVLIKELVRFGFGVVPTLGGLIIQTPRHMPCTRAELHIQIKGHPIALKYVNRVDGERKIAVDGKAAPAQYDSLIDTMKLTIPSAELHDSMIIEVTD
ncbi:MAG: GH36-type glycosyl hydrolase domain-containing protein [Acutalibacteraceae bacterium]